MAVLSENQVSEFKRDGVLLLRGVFNDWTDTLRKGVESNMRDPGPWRQFPISITIVKTTICSVQTWDPVIA